MSDQLSAARAAVDTAEPSSSTRRAAPRRGRRPRTARSPSPGSTSTRSLAYDLAHAAAAVEGSKVMCTYAEHGEIESMLARAYVADAVWDVATRMLGRDRDVGRRRRRDLAPALPFVEAHRAPEFLDALGEQCAKHGTGPTHLSDDFELVADTFRRFAEDKIRPVAEHVHRTNARRARGHHHRPRRARRLRPLGARGVRRVGDRRRAGLHRHGRRDRGAVAGLARHRRFARHPPRDPHARARRGRHRRAEAAVAAAHRDRRADGRDHGDRARLRLRRRGREGHRGPGRRRLEASTA